MWKNCEEKSPASVAGRRASRLNEPEAVHVWEGSARGPAAANAVRAPFRHNEDDLVRASPQGDDQRVVPADGAEEAIVQAGAEILRDPPLRTGNELEGEHRVRSVDLWATGYQVTPDVAGTNPRDPEAAAAEINDKVARKAAISIPANIAARDALQNLVDETNRAFGQIDICVCNAASNPYFGPMGGISDEQFMKILQNNIVSNHWLINMCAPQMRERRDGAIIIISSIGGLRGSPVIGAYDISKAADMQLARSLAVEWGPRNVRVNCIAPGLIRTDFARALWENPEVLDAVVKKQPLRRIGEPDEIAGAAVFLASAAGSFTTGQTFVIDGGSTIADR